MRGWTILIVTLLVGVGLGVAGAVLVPPAAAPYLPPALGGRTRVVEGLVVAKQREPNQVLLKVETAQGPVLATFTTMVSQIDLLVDRGDVVALTLPAEATFVNDPRIERVKRAAGRDAPRSEPTSPR